MRVINDKHLNQMTIIRHEGKLGHTEHMGKETQQNRSLWCDSSMFFIFIKYAFQKFGVSYILMFLKYYNLK